MNNNVIFTDKRLLEALDYIDESFIAEVTEDYKVYPAANEYVRDNSTRAKITRSLKYVAAVAAVALLMSTLIPVVQYVSGNLHMIIPGLLEGTSELTEESQTELENVTTEKVIEYPDFDKPFPEDEIRNAYFSMYPSLKIYYNDLVIVNRGSLGDAFAVYFYYLTPEMEDLAVIGTDYANGYTFYFSTHVTTQIYYEGEFYSIGQAFEKSIISAKDVEKLYNYHKLLYPNFYKSSEGESHE